MAIGDKISATEQQQWTEHMLSKDNPHSITASQIDALPIGGGYLTGDLFIYKKWPMLDLTDSEQKTGITIQSYNGYFTLGVKDAPNNGLWGLRQIEINSPSSNSDLATSFVLIDGKSDGSIWKPYYIYGQHNLSLLKENLQLDKIISDVNTSISKTAFHNKSLNGANFDTTYNLNMVGAFANEVDGKFITYPSNPGFGVNWFNVLNLYSTHFISQIGMTCSSSSDPNRKVDLFIREKYMNASNIWSNWRQITPIYQTTDPGSGSSLGTGNVLYVYE